ncbi:hypothetical protein GDO78_016588 [Eleutherodactylus coqui]|uniref:NTR domain-containing protein n=1 Tax=Eleutherodactylus coqui TaxID=57060 RepID=A0A8J6K0L5_ELECQ|nr:hypothetical protein GDO78_016588 [Eleutherodactylus coqui]
MLPGAGCALMLLVTAAAVTQRDVLDSPSPSREVVDRPSSIHQPYSPPPHLTRPGNERKTPARSDKKTKTKLTLDNNTGLRKAHAHHGNSLPANGLHGRVVENQYGGSAKAVQNRNQLDSVLAPPQIHSKGAASQIPDHESNRPRKLSAKATEIAQNSSKVSWNTNRHPSSLLQHFNGFRKDSKDRTCLMDYHKERDEREAYCHSDFAVNGIVHDVDSVGRDVQLLTVLVNSGGLYKMNRLYITPDGVFFRVRILVVNNPHCHQSCLHFSLGGRYIIMGQVYNKRMEVPTSIQQVISTHLRAGDGLVTSGRSFFRRFNRKKERKVLAAAHSKCK